MKEKYLANSVLVFLILCSCTAIYISFHTNSILAYNDATAHLNTSRRIIDNLTPGLVQIGSVWLPLLHLALLPFVANFFLWQTGLAGSIVSGISFVIGGVFLYKLLFYTTKSAIAGVVGVAFYALNFNMLYLQSTPMFEPLLIATAVCGIYYMERWSVENNYAFLILAAFFTMLSTLTRYDGWAYFLTMSVFVFVRSIQRKKSWDGPVLVFVMLAVFGIAMWFFYNYLIFHNALYFMNGEYSAGAQQKILAARGQLPTKNNLLLSAITYTLSIVFNIGILPAILFVIGLIYYLGRNIKRITILTPLLLITPYIFNIISLYFGQSVIWLPMIPPYFHTYFNARYGVLMLPAVAYFIGYLSMKNKIAGALVLVLLGFQVALFANKITLPNENLYGMISLKDTVSSVNSQTKNASQFIHTHYSKGLILASSASEDAFIFRAGLPLHDFITEGTGNYWRESLQNPAKWATWIVFFNDTSDRVGKVVSHNSVLTTAYSLKYKDQTYQIWEKN